MTRADHHVVPPPRSGGRPLLRPLDAREGPERLRLAVVGRQPTDRPRRGAGAAGRHGQLLAGLAVQRHVPRPSLAQLHGAQRPHAQGSELRPDRRHHGGRDHLAARDPRRRAQLGLPLHLDPRLLLHAALALPARVRLGGARVLRLRARGGGRAEAADFDLQIMYGIDGRKDLTEHTLDHLSGWRNSRPVRVGNGAWDQHQNDVWGMLLDAVDIHLRQGAAQIVKPVWEGVAKLVDAAIAHAGDPDQGIWEIRGEPQHFTASKVLCWVAMDRGADLARIRQDHDRAEAWRKAADELKAEILDQGVDSRGRFRQHYGNDELDASLLLIPILGVPAARRRAGAGHRARHRRRADRGRAGPALQGGHHRHRLRGQGRHLHHLLVLAGHGAGHDRRARAGPGPVQEAARLRRAAAALRRGDRRHDRASTSATSRRPSPTWRSSTRSAGSSRPSAAQHRRSTISGYRARPEANALDTEYSRRLAADAA